MPVARWVLPVPGGPRKTTFSRAVTKSRVPRWAIRSRFRPRAWSKSNSSRTCGPGTGPPGSGLPRRGTPARTPRVAGRRPGTPHGSTTRRGPARPAGAPLPAAWVPSTPGSGTPPRRSGPGAAAVVRSSGGHQRHRLCPGRCPERCRSRPVPAARPLLRGAVTGGHADAGAAQQVAAARWSGSVDGLVPGPDPLMVGDHPAVAEHLDPVQVGDDLDPAADHATGGPSSRCSPGGRSGRGPAGSRTATRSRAGSAAAPASRARSAAIRSVGAHPNARRRRVLTISSQPCSWVLKSAGPGERPAGQEGALQVVVGPFDDTLVPPGSAGRQTITLVPSTPRNAWQSRVELGLPAPPPADRTLPVPHQRPWHRARARHEPPPAGEQVLRPPRRDQHGRQPPGVAGHHRQHRQLRRRCGPARTRPAA